VGQRTLVYHYQAMLKKVTLMNYPVDVVLLLLAEAEDVEGLVGEQHVLLVVDRVDAHLETILGLVHCISGLY
jgi:hypothetical protein